MKGEIFNLLEGFIISLVGEEKFEEIYRVCLPNLETKQAYVGPESYPDKDFFQIVKRAVSVLGVEKEAAIKSFGKYCFPRLFAKIPESQRKYSNLKEFLLTINDVIHVEVKKLSPNATPPEFTYIDAGPNELVMVYKSKRKLYDFVEGMIESAAEYFLTTVFIRRETVEGSEESCKFHIKFG